MDTTFESKGLRIDGARATMEAAIEETERRVAALTDAEIESMTFGSFYKAMKADLGPEIKAFKKKIKAALREAMRVRFASAASPEPAAAAPVRSPNASEEDVGGAEEQDASDEGAASNDSEAVESPPPPSRLQCYP